MPHVSSTATASTTASPLDDPKKACLAIFKLPEELLHAILKYCEGEEPPHGEATTEHYPTNHEWSVLKTLRLVNRAYNDAFIPRLFQTITLYQHSGDWERLDSIANTPTLASSVKHIRLAHIGYVKQISDFEQWKTTVSCVCGGEGMFTRHPPAGGPLARWDFSAEASWKRYECWRAGELMMRKHDQNMTAPRVALNLLINLQTIETIGIGPLRTVKRKPWKCSYGVWRPMPETRRYFETGLNDQQNVMSGWPDAEHCRIPSSHLQTMIIALRTCGRDLSKLVLHRFEELWYIGDIGVGLRSLKELTVDTRSVPYNYYGEEYNYRLSPWIIALDSLESVTIRHNPAATNVPDLCELLQQAHWPKLRRMELINVVTSNDNIQHFIAKHLKKLEYLHVFEPVMSPADWKTFSREAAYCRDAYPIPGKTIRISVNSYPQPVG